MQWMISNLQAVVDIDWKLDFIRSMSMMTPEQINHYVKELQERRKQLAEAVKHTVQNNNVL